jgi:hypothetical protein
LKGEVDQQGGALATGAGDRDRPAQRLDAVGEPDESRAASGGGTTDAVVADRQVQAAVPRLPIDVRSRRLGVLGGVGERLGDYVVRRDLDLFGQPRRDVHTELHRDDRAAGEGLERARKATVQETCKNVS